VPTSLTWFSVWFIFSSQDKRSCLITLKNIIFLLLEIYMTYNTFFNIYALVKCHLFCLVSDKCCWKFSIQRQIGQQSCCWQATSEVCCSRCLVMRTCVCVCVCVLVYTSFYIYSSFLQVQNYNLLRLMCISPTAWWWHYLQKLDNELCWW